MRIKKLLGAMAFGCAIIAAVSFANVNKVSAAKSGDYTYSKTSEGITITKYNGKEAKVKIPAKIAGRKVTTIGFGAFCNNKYVKNITMPDSVELIADSAFSGCKKLKKIKLSKNLTRVKYRVFEDCSSLKKISFPAKVVEVKGECFKDCTSLEQVSYSANTKVVTASCFYGCKSLRSFDFKGIEEIEQEAFSGCVSLKGELNLADVAEISMYAFEGCTGITGVTFSDTLQLLGNYAYINDNKPNIQAENASNPFIGCKSLTNFNIPSTNVNFCSVEGVIYGKSGEWLVAYPAGRTGEYTVAATVKGIGTSSFEGSQLTGITIPDSVNYIYSRAFKDSMITKIKLPDYNKSQTQYCGPDIFNGLSRLESFAFPEGMKDNSVITLSDCTSLKTVTLPKSLELLKGEVFRGCRALNNVVLPNSCKDIPAKCFYGCTSLSNINLGKIENFGTESFGKCKSLTGKLNLASAKKISARAFTNCTGITEITLSSQTMAVGVKNSEDAQPVDTDYELDTETGVSYDSYLYYIPYDINSNAFDGCKALEAIKVPADNVSFASVEGCLYNKEMTELVCVPAKKTGKFSVPYGVETIAPLAFFGTNVDSVVLSNSVMDIWYFAFVKCGMKSLTIPKRVYNIYEAWNIPTFSGCNKLAEINVKSGNECYESKDGILFSKKGKKKLMCYPAAKKSKSYTIPKKCTIANGAFNGCKYLKKLTVPADSGITTIPVIASNCTNMNVYLTNKVRDYNYIYVDASGNSEEQYVVFGANAKNCKIYIKKKSKLIKKFDYYGVSYKIY